MIQYLLVSSGLVENIVVWDGASDWTPPEGQTLVEYTGDVVAGVGFAWDGSNPIPPPPTPQMTASGTSTTKINNVTVVGARS